MNEPLLAAWRAPAVVRTGLHVPAGMRKQRKVLVLGVLAAVQLVALTDLGVAAARYAGVVSRPGSHTSTTATSAPEADGPRPDGLVTTAPFPTVGLPPGATITSPPATTASTARASSTAAASTAAASASAASAAGKRSKATSTTSHGRR